MNKKIVLASAPFGPLNAPSIGLTILKNFIENNRDWLATIEYLGIRFADIVGVKFYNAISSGYPANTELVGEFIFAYYFYEKKETQLEEFIKKHIVDVKKGQEEFKKDFIDTYIKAIKIIPEWVKSTAHYLAGTRADIYAFTSMFQQNMSSLSVARELKKILPHCLIILGGANVEDPMGMTILEEYQFIDMVCSGEGEEALLSVIDFLETDDLSGLHPNIRHLMLDRKNKMSGKKIDLNLLSTPKYDDYIQQISVLRESGEIKPRLLIETSRGCWWGQKSHCLFCGLNGSNISFRSKTAEKALAEILELSEKYPNMPISIVDNIFDYKYFETLIPMLISCKRNVVELFIETKANLRKSQLKMLREAGVSRIQPGIESLSTNVLKIIRKGINSIQNICLLKWCAEENIQPEWNIIWGFPGEDPDDYKRMASFMPYLFHLHPPNGANQIRLDRFSPLYEKYATGQITNVRPYDSYYDVYDIPKQKVYDIAYYFEFDYKKHCDVDSYTNSVADKVKSWKHESESAYLFYVVNPDGVLVFDGRINGNELFFKFSCDIFYLLQKCEKPKSINALIKEKPKSISEEKLLIAIDKLVEKGIIIFIDNLLFNLAVDISYTQHNKIKFKKFLSDLVSLDNKLSSDKITVHLMNEVDL